VISRLAALLVIAGAAGSATASPRGQVKIIPPAADTGTAAPISRIIYLNRCVGSCVYRESQTDDARFNQTVVGGGPVGSTYTLSEFAYGDATWDAVVACMRENYAPYDVEITDIDPGTEVAHHEVVIAGTADQLDHDPTMVGGVGPLASDCSLHDNAVSFAFANMWPDDPIMICAVAAQETGHGFGLEHAFNCADPMTYLPACGLQFFRNEYTDCGEFTARGCMCSTGGQNSHSKLRAALGSNPVPLPGPDVTLQTPTASQTVGAGFGITATAIDRRGLSKVELWFNGYMWSEVEVDRETQQLVLAAPAELPDGVIDVELRVFNDIRQAYGVGAVTVTKGAPCASADTCLAGQRCDAGRCMWDPPSGELGAACDYPQFCLSAQCESGECSQPCGGAVVCPFGFECVDQMWCHTDGLGEDAGGCCSSGGASGSAVLAQLGLAGLVLGGVLRRRRAR
jgi:MYXO-CTERM domain-containing protein